MGKVEPVKKVEEPKKAEPAKTSQAPSSILIDLVTEIKNRANAKFKAQDMEGAIGIYSEAINLYQKEKCPRSEGLDTLIGQVYTNRALMHHNVGDQVNAAKDSTYVLENLDAKNTKALNRRAYAARVAQKWEEAVRDY